MSAAAPARPAWGARLAVCAGMTALLRLPSFTHALMDIDEASYAAVACRLLAGGLPYRDAVENKPPAIYYVYTWVFALFGRYQMLALHVLVALVALATALVCAALARDALDDAAEGERAAWLAAIAYTAYSTTYYGKMLAANTEMFLVLPAALAVWCHRRARGRAPLLMAAGALVALATLFKQVAGLVGLALLVDAAWEAWRARRPGVALRAAVWLGVGFVLPLAALVLWYRRLGILDDAVFWVFTYIARYYLSAGGQRFVANLAIYLAPFLLLMSPLCVLAARVRRQRLMWLWLAAGVAAALAGGRMYGHYFLQFVPPLCVLAAIGGAPLFAPGAAASWPRRLFVVGTPLVAIGALLPALVYDAVTERFFGPTPDYRPAAAWVRAHSAPDDGIFVWGWFPPFYVAADRCPATRFPTTHLLAGAGVGPRGHSVPSGWDALWADLQRHPPRLILDTSVGDYRFEGAPLSRYPALAAFVAARYHEAATVAGVRIYLLDETAARASDPP